jgi:hypothetical protein
MALDKEWDALASVFSREATTNKLSVPAVELERQRCISVVNAEIMQGSAAGVPGTSVFIAILRRIAATIERG